MCRSINVSLSTNDLHLLLSTSLEHGRTISIINKIPNSRVVVLNLLSMIFTYY
jgi:hypothetical protein